MRMRAAVQRAAIAVVLLALSLPASASAGNGGLQQRPQPSWSVRIDYKGKPGCSGALVAPTWILTAAHCTKGRPGRYMTVRIAGMSLTPAASYSHPRYVKQATPSYPDVGLVRLSSPLPFRPLPIGTADDLRYFTGRGVSVFGYGASYRMAWRNDRTGKIMLKTGPLKEIVEKIPDHVYSMGGFCQLRGAQCFIRAPWASAREIGVGPGDSGGPWVGWRDGGWRLLAVTGGVKSFDVMNIIVATSPAATMGEPSPAKWVNGALFPARKPVPAPAAPPPAPSPIAAPAPSPLASPSPPPPSPPPPSPPPPTVPDRMSNDARLYAASNQYLQSADGRYRFVMQHDSNLVLYGPSGAIWATNTVGRGASHLRMQGDGNLVIYDGADRPIWASGTPRHYASFLVVQNDGNVVIYNNGAPIWATNTAGRR